MATCAPNISTRLHLGLPCTCLSREAELLADTGTPRQGEPVERPLGGQCPAEYAVSYQPEDGRNYGEGLGRRPSVLRVENAFLPETSSGPAGRRGSERDSRTHAEAQEDRRSEQTDERADEGHSHPPIHVGAAAQRDRILFPAPD